jgi:formylglycine-generating enzyme required for sulfatase activity
MTIWVMVIGLCLINSPVVLADCPSADLTGDCFVDFEDFALMANQWLTTDPCVPGDMVYIPDGNFVMGDHLGDGYSNELPLHAVLLDAFFMSKFEITNQQYCDYLNSALGSGSIYLSSDVVYGTGNDQGYCDTSASSSYSYIVYSSGVFTVGTKGGRDMSDDPMVEVSWYGSVAYCNWRSTEGGYEACYNLSTWDCDFSKNGYRLATEAEWEYAARGGLAGKRFPWNDPNISHSRANYYASPGSYPYDENPTTGYHPDWNDGVYPYTSPAGTFAANGYGLYDMAGNVWEWCNDWYASDYYDTSPFDNPAGPASGTYRVLRGGGWHNDANFCRVAYRNYSSPDDRNYNFGFRIVLDLE